MGGAGAEACACFSSNTDLPVLLWDSDTALISYLNVLFLAPECWYGNSSSKMCARLRQQCIKNKHQFGEYLKKNQLCSVNKVATLPQVDLMGFEGFFLIFCWLVGNVISALPGTLGFSRHSPTGLIQIYNFFWTDLSDLKGSTKTLILQSKLLLSHMLHVELWGLVGDLLLMGLEKVRESLGSICIMVFSSCLGLFVIHSVSFPRYYP